MVKCEIILKTSHNHDLFLHKYIFYKLFFNVSIFGCSCPAALESFTE